MQQGNRPLTGTIVNYFIHCKRQCWLFGNMLNMEDNSEDVHIGKVLHELGNGTFAGTVTFTYDVLKRLMENEIEKAIDSVTFIYDVLKQLSLFGVLVALEAVTFTYDVLKRVGLCFPDALFSAVTFTYDVLKQHIVSLLKAESKTVTFTYDVLKQRNKLFLKPDPFVESLSFICPLLSRNVT
jgi:hypothetical protein